MQSASSQPSSTSLPSRSPIKALTLIAAASALSIATLIGSTAEAKVFRNSYVSFELPDKWDCALEQTEWVCRPNDPALSQQAIIILTAKEVGPSDALNIYEGHLKTPRTIASRTGAPLQSNVLRVQQTTIANHVWVDGMHLSSEVPNYYTRYLATTKDKIAILVTFSAHTLHYTKYSGDFMRAIQSLRVIATKALLNGTGVEGGGGPGSSTFGTDPQIPMDMDELPTEGSDSSSSTAETVFGLAILLAAIGAYLVLKKKQQSKKR